jgi:glutamyl-tRNA reductase
MNAWDASMHIHCLGLNHRTTEVAVREKMAFHEDGLKAALARTGCRMHSRSGQGFSPLCTEMVILSTCNRVELYAVRADPDPTPLKALMAELKDISPDELPSNLYHYLDQSAVEHLFQVTAGLDSLVLGEPQILGQVMAAFELARGQDAIGPLLSRLFQAALHTGKRARTETAISHNPASISSVAVHLAHEIVPDLEKAQIVILGAGEMAELSVEALRKRGATHITVVNRTLERAAQLAERWHGLALTFEKLPQAIQSADILISSTGAPHTLIHAGTVKQALRTRPERPIVMIDIAVPRDIDPEVGELAGASLVDMDMLQSYLDHSLSKRAGEVPRVDAIITEELGVFTEYLRTLEIVPLISEMRRQADEIRKSELEKTLRRMPNLTQAEIKRLDAMTQALMKKLLHTPITRLKEEAASASAADYAETTRRLFGL